MSVEDCREHNVASKMELVPWRLQSSEMLATVFWFTVYADKLSVSDLHQQEFPCMCENYPRRGKPCNNCHYEM